MSERERWAYEELQPGDTVQEGDEWQNPDGRWQAIVLTPEAIMEVGDVLRARRPHKVSAILEIGDALANAQKATTQLQDERDEACMERDLARAEVARLSTELWARKPLEDRVAALTEELAQAREESQQLLQTITDNADQFVWAGKTLEQQRDEARAEAERLSTALKSAQRARDELQLQVDELRAGLMGVVSAEHVYAMLEDMLDQTEWVGQCLDSTTYEQMSCIQRTISVIAQRVNDMGKGGASADA